MNEKPYLGEFAVHQFQEVPILQILEEVTISGKTIPKGYVNVTQLCKSHKKKLGHWNELKGSMAYLEALSMDIVIPISMLMLKLYDQANAMDAESKDQLLGLPSTQTTQIAEGS